MLCERRGRPHRCANCAIQSCEIAPCALPAAAPRSGACLRRPAAPHVRVFQPVLDSRRLQRGDAAQQARSSLDPLP